MTIDAQLCALRDRWSPAKPHERGSAQAYLIELCEALGVERPRPPGSGYEFELTIDAITTDGREAKNFIDLWKAGHFALEAKDHDSARSNDILLRRAFGQVRNYVAHTPGDAPPYIAVLDVGRTLIVWDRWSGSYGGFAAGRRIDLATLHQRPEDVALLRDVWQNPSARDPRGRAQAVTTEIAGRLARLAASLESRGHDPEQVARFLMRVVFSCFAEDIGLLPQEAFRHTVTEAGLRGSPEQFTEAVTALWRAMDTGGLYGFLRLMQFNGHFFRRAEALPLTQDDLVLLEEAAKADWAHVEPSIFGTLLVRALNPAERHRLGAEYTPRAFIERLVRPTVEEPLRERWTAVQAEVLQLRETGKKKDQAQALERLTAFHAWMRSLRFLDPACGSGNFLYVTMHIVKKIELEVIREIEETQGQAALRFDEVGPWQFYGIEVKGWAREIAELVLWIGHHQFWREHHSVQPSEPILRDTGTLECRDAVLAWDEIRHAPSRGRPDPTPRIPHPVTGDLVPDPTAKVPYMEHLAARPAAWPDADFIVGNPPYLGQARQRETFGDGYVDALRAAYPDVPDAADLVTYWWYRAAEMVADGTTIRAGLITTNKITQTQNRAIIANAAAKGARVCWAVADHVWYDGADGAEVRVAMTVIAREPSSALLVRVAHVERVTGDVPVIETIAVPCLNVDLTAHADLASAAAQPLRANAGMVASGFKPHGSGFLLPEQDAHRLIASDPSLATVVKPFRNGKDLTARPRGVYIIDFGARSQEEARQYSVLFDIVRDRVKPERDANPEPSRRMYWWRFGRTNEMLRTAVASLTRYIATAGVSKHRFFTFLSADIAPEDGIRVIASDDPYLLGVLSSTIHIEWALAAGGRMGVRHTPRYNQSVCFDPFPFPDVSPDNRQRIAAVAMHIEEHRSRAIAADPAVTMMKMYDVVEALKAGRPLPITLQAIHTTAACGVLRDLHDDLDTLVAEAYGWSWPEPKALILERLVALHDSRIEEERAGRIRWIRPDYQQRRFGAGAQPTEQLLGDALDTDVTPEGRIEIQTWPVDAVGQITVLRQMAATAPVSVAEAAARLRGARPDMVARHLQTLAILGEVQEVGEGRYAAATAAVDVLRPTVRRGHAGADARLTGGGTVVD